MAELARFQDAFAATLRDGGPLEGYGEPARLEAGLSVYRNTTFKGLLDALRSNYPTVARLVGDDWFDASARAYLDIAWPSHPALVAFGEHYPDFLAFFEPAQALPYLAGVARLDRSWTEAHVAPDAPALVADAFAGRGAEELAGVRLRLHPSARLAWFGSPCVTIWRLNRPPAPEPGEIALDDAGEGALIARPYGQVAALDLDAADFALLDACRRGETLAAAGTAAFAADRQTDLARRFADFIGFGAFLPLP